MFASSNFPQTPSSPDDIGRSSSSGGSLLAKLNELALIGRLAPPPLPPSQAEPLSSPQSSPLASGLPGSAREQHAQPSLYRQLNASLGPSSASTPASAAARARGSSAGTNNGFGFHGNSTNNALAAAASASVDSRTFRRPHGRGFSAGVAGSGGGGLGGFDDATDGGASASSQERLHDLTDVQIVAKMQIDALRQQVLHPI